MPAPHTHEKTLALGLGFFALASSFSAEHRYRPESAPAFECGGEPIPNLTRLETFGGQVNVHGVLVTMDPGAPEVFLAGPLPVPGAPLPIFPLPRAK